MKLNKEKFQLKLLSDIRKKYEGAELINNEIYFKYGAFDVIIDMEVMYELYIKEQKYETVKIHCLNAIQEVIKENKIKINYDKVFPMIKSRDYGLQEEVKFIRDNFTLDLDILYVVDLDHIYRFLTVSDNINLEKIKISAIKNLDEVHNYLIKIDDDLPIYTTALTSDLGGTMILSEKFLNIIQKKVGKNFLFAIPTSDTLLVAKNQYYNINYLKELIKVCPKTDTISENVYLYKDGKVSFADKGNVLKIIK